MRLIHKIGTPQEQAQASTRVKMADFKRQQAAAVLNAENGIELPASFD